MFSNQYPVFNRGRILKIEMLEHLRDFPRDIINTYFHGYANGILTGCKLSINDDYIIISPGIIYFDEVIYGLKQNHLVPYTYTNESLILKIQFMGENSNKDFISYATQISLDHDTKIYKDEIELCRFKLKEGAKLRDNYINFEDMTTEYNTVNIIHSPFATYKNSTLSPDVLTCFAKEAFKYKLINPLDISFCMHCLQNQQPISRELIVNYISSRLEIKCEDDSNEKIYKYLVDILQNIRCSKDSGGHRNYLSKKILLD